ncbi:hypothetical protein Vadar_031904 [Vaccinium darrowii]|uniref:Uncharacterized protein n=1 Tax=Vaccinium darrowii TaxID=229202 RepID=A0ACB7XLE8_9ERIC|nr:hypothetical protein Vadar_031904 [Vaccinium darrowii]
MGRSNHGHAVKYEFDEDVCVNNLLITPYSAFGFLNDALRVFDELWVRDIVTWMNWMLIDLLAIGTALVDMYGKCGCMERAAEVLKGMPQKDILALRAMISAFSLHGYCKEAFDLFNEMKELGVRPNYVTYVAFLSAGAD